MPESFRIESDQDDIVLRFNRNLVDPTTPFPVARSHRTRRTSESLQKASELSPEQAENIADDIDAAVWNQVKDTYTT